MPEQGPGEPRDVMISLRGIEGSLDTDGTLSVVLSAAHARQLWGHLGVTLHGEPT